MDGAAGQTGDTTTTAEPEEIFAFKVHTYTRYYGNWKHLEEIMFFTLDEITDSDSVIFTTNANVLREMKPESGEEWREVLEAMTPSNQDPHFPSVSYNGGMHVITDEEYSQALNTIRNYDKSMNNVIDLPGILTTADAEQDRYHLYVGLEYAKKIVRCYEAMKKARKEYGVDA